MSEFRLLGPVEVVSEGRAVPLGPPKQRCVLARLLLDPGMLIPTERLFAAMWEEDPPGTARKAVHVYVSNLRRALADVPRLQIRTSSGGYRIDVDHRQVDLHLFRELAEHRDSRTALKQALALWRGEPFTGLADCPLRVTEGARLSEERMAVIERRARLDLYAGDSASVIPVMYELTAAQPWRETAYVLLLRALATEGRLGEALAVYAEVRERLLDQLGTEPSATLTAVHQELLQADGVAVMAGTANAPENTQPAPGKTPEALREAVTDAFSLRAHDGVRIPPVPAQLPARLPELAGREAELAQLRDLLTTLPADGVRVVAVSGYGGIGKTALTVAAAHAVAERFDGGQLYADLAGSSATPADPADLLAGFLRAYGMSGDRIPVGLADRAALFRSLTAGQRVLLLLDDAYDADHVRPLLPGSAGCAVLVTSRARPAGLDGLRMMPLHELADTEAVTLLTDYLGADRVRAEPAAAKRIVDQCGGVPLAVRIAAGRLARSGWSLTDFADRLVSAPLLDELYDGDLEVRASFGLSYQRLDEKTAWVFRMLAIPDAPQPTLVGAAEALELDERTLRRILDGLVDLHLLEEPAPGRYRYHDLVRRFAVEQSTETDSAAKRTDVIQRACMHYAARALDALAAMVPSLDLRVPPGDRPGFDSFEAALRWLAAEHVTVTDLALQLLDIATQAVVDQMAAQLGYLTLVLGNYAEVDGAWPGWEELASRLLGLALQHGGENRHPATTTAEETEDAEKWEKLASRARYVLAGIAMRRGDLPASHTHLEPVLADARRRDDQWAYGRTLAMLGVAQREAGHRQDSWRTLREALRAHRRVGYARGYAATLVHLADTHNSRRDSTAAAGCARATLRLEEALEDVDAYLQLGAYLALGDARAQEGRRAEAHQCFRQALELNRTHGSPTLHNQVARKLAQLGESEN